MPGVMPVSQARLAGENGEVRTGKNPLKESNEYTSDTRSTSNNVTTDNVTRALKLSSFVELCHFCMTNSDDRPMKYHMISHDPEFQPSQTASTQFTSFF
eukprot:2290997-Pyramimonas_sp.AAC.1